MAKGIHLAQNSNRIDDPSKLRRHAYLEVATALNESVHKNDYRNDIDKREVSRMIDWVLLKRKGIVGTGGYMERASPGRITRGLKMLWRRPTRFDFNGSVAEWNLGRKGAEAEKQRIANGGAPREGSAFVGSYDQGNSHSEQT